MKHGEKLDNTLQSTEHERVAPTVHEDLINKDSLIGYIYTNEEGNLIVKLLNGDYCEIGKMQLTKNFSETNGDTEQEFKMFQSKNCSESYFCPHCKQKLAETENIFSLQEVYHFWKKEKRDHFQKYYQEKSLQRTSDFDSINTEDSKNVSGYEPSEEFSQTNWYSKDTDLVLDILSTVAKSECHEVKKRQAVGIAEAKKNGVKFGRPRLEKPEKFLEVCERHWNEELTATEAAYELDISRTTFRRWYAESFLKVNSE